MQSDDNPSLGNPRLPEGQRVYAIGPVQGKIELLRQLLMQVYCDSRIRKPASTSIVFLGDVMGAEPLAIDLIVALSQINCERLIVLRCPEDALFWTNFIDESVCWKYSETKTDSEAQSREHGQPYGGSTIYYGAPHLNSAAVNCGAKPPLSWSAGGYTFLPKDARMPDRRVIIGDQVSIKDLPGDDSPPIDTRPSRVQLSVRRQTSLGSERIAISNAAGQYDDVVALVINGDEMLLMRTRSESNALADLNDLSDIGAPPNVSAHNFINEIAQLICAIIGSPAPESQDNIAKPEIASQAPPAGAEDIPNTTRRINRPIKPAQSIFLVLLVSLSAVILMRPSVPDRSHRDLRSLPITANPAPLKRIDGITLPRAALPPILSSNIKERTAPLAQPEEHMKIKRKSKRLSAVLLSEHFERERHSADLRRPSTSSQGTGQAFHLTGKALEVALAADRVATRNLNNIELDKIRAALRCRRHRRRGQNAC